MNRRVFLGNALGVSMASVPRSVLASVLPAVPDVPYSIAKTTVERGIAIDLHREIAAYIAEMNAPGLTFSLTDAKGHEHIATYGYERQETKKPLLPERLFQIGSISKSMAAVLCMQLVDEGKLDLHKPVMDYLPWLPWETSRGPVTAHHILTHTSGMPNGGPLFFADPGMKHKQRNAPGAVYFYSNMAYNVIGHLVAHLDGRNYQASLVERLFKPCGMHDSRPQLGGTEWSLQSESYIPAEQDRLYLRHGKLRVAPQFHEETSAGCVASTADNMAKYMRMLLRKGVCDNGRRIVSEAAMEQMFHPHIATDEFTPGGSYGYGLAVSKDDGDTVLIHTGGMVSFMSAIHLNLSRGIGSFASINAQQGYRPTLVTQYAARLMGQAIAPVKARLLPIQVPDVRSSEHSEEIAGQYVLPTGYGSAPHEPTHDQRRVMDGAPGSVAMVAYRSALSLKTGAKLTPLEIHGDRLLSDDPLLGADAWHVVRREGKIVGLQHGYDFYLRDGVAMPTFTPPPAAWQAHVGSYVNDDPWQGSSRVVMRFGELYLDGSRLEDAGDGTFFILDEPMCPDRAQFACIVDGKSQVLLVNGTPLRRFTPA